MFQQIELQPNKSWNKTKLKDWLTKHEVQFDQDMTKVELAHLETMGKRPVEYKAEDLVVTVSYSTHRKPQLQSSTCNVRMLLILSFRKVLTKFCVSFPTIASGIR